MSVRQVLLGESCQKCQMFPRRQCLGGGSISSPLRKGAGWASSLTLHLIPLGAGGPGT